MDISKSGSEIADRIRLKVIYEGLELDEIGIDFADITDDIHLFDEDGLNLDSIDALEIIAGVQREFGLSLANVDQAFMDEHCATVGRLASMVVNLSSDTGMQGQAPSEIGGGDDAATASSITGQAPDEAGGSLPSNALAGEPRIGPSAAS